MPDQAFLPRIFRLLVKLLCLAVGLSAASPILAATRYLDKSATGLNDGSSPLNAWNSVAVMNLQAFVSGDVLEIQGGDYSTEELWLYFPSKTNITFRIAPSAVRQAVFKACQFYQANGCALDGDLNGTQMFKFNGLADVNGTLASSILIRDTNTFIVKGVETDHTGLTPVDGRDHHGIAILGAVVNGTITDNNIHHTLTDGININSNDPALGPGVFDGFVISGNLIYNIGDDGIQSSYGNITIDNNTIDQAGATLFPGAHPDGIQINPDQNSVRIYNNTLKGWNQSVFVELVNGSGNIEIYNNIIIGLSPDPLGVQLHGYTCRALAFSSRNTYTGTFLFSNNVCYNFRYFIALNGGLSNSPGCTKVFKNNIFMQCKYVCSNSTEAAMLDSSNIDWTASVQFYETSVGAPVSTPGQRNIGNCVTKDPKFTNAAEDDFTLTAGSYAIHAGTSLSAYFTTDYSGNPRTSSWDIGAYAYNPTSPVITVQPPAQMFAVFGSTTSLTVVAGGQAPLSYQWKKNGGNLVNGGKVSGAASDTLTLTGVAAGDGGTYTVDVTDARGALVTSNNSVLTINQTTTVTTTTPATKSGGGASSPWFVLALAVASALRFRARLFR